MFPRPTQAMQTMSRPDNAGPGQGVEAGFSPASMRLLLGGLLGLGVDRRNRGVEIATLGDRRQLSGDRRVNFRGEDAVVDIRHLGEPGGEVLPDRLTTEEVVLGLVGSALTSVE